MDDRFDLTESERSRIAEFRRDVYTALHSVECAKATIEEIMLVAYARRDHIPPNYIMYVVEFLYNRCGRDERMPMERALDILVEHLKNK